MYKFRTIIFIALLVIVFSNNVQAEKAKIYSISPERIAEYIDKTAGQKRVLYIHTSWCPYCRKKMPDIMNIERKKKGSVIAVSVDEDPKKYVSYAKSLKQVPFPLIINKGNEGYLMKVLSKYKIKKWSGYPTMIFLDDKGMAVRQGNFTVQQAAQYIMSD